MHLDMMRTLSFYRLPTKAQNRAIKANGGVYIETDKRRSLQVDYHYTDSRFNAEAGWPERTIYGKKREGLTYHYSDRLENNDISRYRKAREDARASGAPVCSAMFYERMLSAYWGEPCEVHHIMAFVSRSDGYPYLIFGYTMGVRA